jgi:SPP1 family predicted phage head-tail adaptor
MGSQEHTLDQVPLSVMEIRAADLDQRIVIKREVTTPDGMGGTTSTWVDVASVWASARPMSGREREQAQRLNAQSNYVFTMRDSAIRQNNVDERDVIYWHGVTFNIRFIPDKARSRFVAVEAERGVASG